MEPEIQPDTPVEPVAETVVEPTSPEPDGSIAEHAAAFGPNLDPAAPPADEDDNERDAQGRFKSRHRARSQEAGPDDVATINTLTKRIKEAEAAAGADIVKQPGESPRVFELRRRAEIAERRRDAAARAEASPAPPVQSPPQAPHVSAKPQPEDFADYEMYLDARDQYNRDRWTAEQRIREDNQRIVSSWQRRVDAAIQAHPDFEDVALKAQTKIPVGSLMDAWILESTAGADLLYDFQSDEPKRAYVHALKPVPQAEALTLLGFSKLKTDQQEALLASLGLTIDTLLGQRLTTTRPLAASTGSAAAPPLPSVPRPPNPVRTGPMRIGDTPPGDEASVLDHARFYGPRARGR